MNSHHRLASLYEEWRLMSESEGDAIRSLAWQRVEHCQRVKADLRGRILSAMEDGGGVRGDAEEIRRHFSPVLQHLISLEIRNSEWLAAGRRKLEEERAGLNRKQRAMRQLRSSYGSVRATC
jgi:hypothetical protein